MLISEKVKFCNKDLGRHHFYIELGVVKEETTILGFLHAIINKCNFLLNLRCLW